MTYNYIDRDPAKVKAGGAGGTGEEINFVGSTTFYIVVGSALGVLLLVLILVVVLICIRKRNSRLQQIVMLNEKGEEVASNGGVSMTN